MRGWATTNGTVTEPDAIKLAKRVEFWRDRLIPLGLGHWRIDQVSIVDETPGGYRAKATVQPSHTYDSCIFWFTHDFLSEASKRDVDETILHEWVHVFMRDFDHAIESVETELSPAAESRWSDWVGHEREGVVDRIARSFYMLYRAEKDAAPAALRNIARSTS